MKHADLRLKTALMVLLASFTFMFVNVSTVLASEISDIPEPGDIEIDRDADILFDIANIEPVDPDRPKVADTALVFTNASKIPSKVRCTAFNKDGHPVGRLWLRLPKKGGLRYVLASDFLEQYPSIQRPFVGSARCRAMGDVIGSVVFGGPGLTDLKVRQHYDRYNAATYLIFPLIAAF